MKKTLNNWNTHIFPYICSNKNMKIKQLMVFFAIGLSSFTICLAQSSIKFKKSKQISVVSFLEMGSILEFYSDKVKLNGTLLEMNGAIRFTTKYMFYPVRIPSETGFVEAEIGWGTKNDHECIIDWGDHTLEQFEMIEVKAAVPVKRKPKK